MCTILADTTPPTVEATFTAAAAAAVVEAEETTAGLEDLLGELLLLVLVLLLLLLRVVEMAAATVDETVGSVEVGDSPKVDANLTVSVSPDCGCVKSDDTKESLAVAEEIAPEIARLLASLFEAS